MYIHISNPPLGFVEGFIMMSSSHIPIAFSSAISALTRSIISASLTSAWSRASALTAANRNCLPSGRR